MVRKIAVIVCLVMTGLLICIYAGTRRTSENTFRGEAGKKLSGDKQTNDNQSDDTRTNNNQPDDTYGGGFPVFQNRSPVTTVQERTSPGSAAGRVLDSVLAADNFVKMKEKGSGNSLSPDDLSWIGGAAAVDYSTGIVYLPCCIENMTAGDKELSPEQSRAVWGSLLAGLKPASESDKIWYLEDRMAENLPAAMEEGHLFEAVLQKEDESIAFSVAVSGLPFLMIDQTDGEEIVEKEDHFGQITVFPLQAFAVAGTRTDSGSGKAPSGIAEYLGKMMTALDSEGTANAASGTALTSLCSFHVRGNFAATMDKKPWKVALKDKNGEQRKESILGMRKDDDWILNPMYSDMSRVREKTGYQLWEKTSAVTGSFIASSRMQYVELLLNGSYHGVYGLTEPLDGRQLGLSDGDLLYKIRQWPWEFDYLSLYSQRTGETEIENGRGGASVRMIYPNQWTESSDWEPMEAFHRFCFKTRDLSTLAEAGIGYDRDSIIQLNLFCSLVQAPDNTWKNSILIAKKVKEGMDPAGTMDQNSDPDSQGLRYVLYRDTWDLNYTFGDHSIKPVEKRQTEFSMERVERYDYGYDCTYDYGAFRTADSSIKQRTNELWSLWREKGITEDYLCGLADTALEELRTSGALFREMQRWPQDQDPADAVEDMKEWIRRRFAFLDRHFELTD